MSAHRCECGQGFSGTFVLLVTVATVMVVAIIVSAFVGMAAS